MRYSFNLALGFLLCSCGGDPNGADQASTGGATATGGQGASGGAVATGGSAGANGGSAGATGGSTQNGGAAGASAGSGSGGTAGSPAHVVGECGALGAVDEWEEITPPPVDLGGGLGTVHVAVDPINAGTIYAGTDKQGLYKSTNCGADWQKVNTGRYAAVLDSGILWSMAIDPVEPNVMYIGSLYGTDVSLLKSTNGGVDWDSLFLPGGDVATYVETNFFQAIAIDSANHEHLLVSFHNNCTGEYAPMCLGESTDAGESWRLFKGPAESWGEAGMPMILDATTFLFTTPFSAFFTSDSGATWKSNGQPEGTMLPSGANPQVPYQAANGYYYLGGLFGMYRSLDGEAWESVPNGGITGGIVGDGTRLFSFANRADLPNVWQTSPANDGLTWTTHEWPATSQGTWFEYEADHHLLYSANTSGGVWRMVTQ